MHGRASAIGDGRQDRQPAPARCVGDGERQRRLLWRQPHPPSACVDLNASSCFLTKSAASPGQVLPHLKLGKITRPLALLARSRSAVQPSELVISQARSSPGRSTLGQLSERNAGRRRQAPGMSVTRFLQVLIFLARPLRLHAADLGHRARARDTVPTARRSRQPGEGHRVREYGEGVVTRGGRKLYAGRRDATPTNATRHCALSCWRP